jgi:hypothetical protein
MLVARSIETVDSAHDNGDLRAARAGYRAVGTAIEDDLDGWPVEGTSSAWTR